jgi:hypothetical protein
MSCKSFSLIFDKIFDKRFDFWPLLDEENGKKVLERPDYVIQTIYYKISKIFLNVT